MTEVSWEPWGQLPSQGCVQLWRLQSSQLKVELLTLGATIKSVFSRGRDGQSADVVLGFDNLEGEKPSASIGVHSHISCHHHSRSNQTLRASPS